MYRVFSASSSLLWKAFAAAGPLSSCCSFTSSSIQQYQCITRLQDVFPLGLKLYSTSSKVRDVSGSMEAEADAIMALECGSIPAGRAAAMLESHIKGDVVLRMGLIKHLAASACFNNAETLRTCLPSELSRFIAAIPPSSSIPVAVLCNVLQQRSSELMADELSTALCNLLHLSQLCITPQSQPSDVSTLPAINICNNLASQLLQAQPHLNLSTPALVKLLSACFRAQHLLPGLDLLVAMEGLWVKLLEETDYRRPFQQLPAHEFAHLLVIGAQLQTSSGIPQQSDTSSKQLTEDSEFSPNTATTKPVRASGLERSERWQHIMHILQQRVLAGGFNVAQLGDIARTLNNQTRHLQMHSSISSNDDTPPDHHHSPALLTVIHAIKQQLPSAPLGEAAAAARSLGQAHLLGDPQLLQAFGNVLDGSALVQLSPDGLRLWLEAACRAVVEARRSCNSSCEESANKMLASAHSLWLAQGFSQSTSTQQLAPLFSALSKVDRLLQSDLRLLLSRCDDCSEWVSVGSEEAVQLVHSCLKARLWKHDAASGLLERVTQLLPSMDVHTFTKLITMLQGNGYACSLLSEQIWHALQSALAQSSHQDMLMMFNAANMYQRPQLRGLIVQQAVARLNMSLDASSCQPLILLNCAAAAGNLLPESAKQEVFQRVKVGELQDHQLALLAFHLPSLGQVDQPLAQQIAAIAVGQLPSSSLIYLARTLSGVNRLGGGVVSDHYSIITRHVVSGVAKGCSENDLRHITAWMLEDSALFPAELPVAVAVAVTKLAASNISCSLAVQLAQLVSQGVIAADVVPVLRQALQHRESQYSAQQLTILLSMLCDQHVAVQEQLIDRLLTLIKSLSNSKQVLQPLNGQLYSIFSKQQHSSSSKASITITARPARPSMPMWLRDIMTAPR